MLSSARCRWRRRGYERRGFFFNRVLLRHVLLITHRIFAGRHTGRRHASISHHRVSKEMALSCQVVGTGVPLDCPPLRLSFYGWQSMATTVILPLCETGRLVSLVKTIHDRLLLSFVVLADEQRVQIPPYLFRSLKNHNRARNRCGYVFCEITSQPKIPPFISATD